MAEASLCRGRTPREVRSGYNERALSTHPSISGECSGATMMWPMRPSDCSLFTPAEAAVLTRLSLEAVNNPRRRSCVSRHADTGTCYRGDVGARLYGSRHPEGVPAYHSRNDPLAPDYARAYPIRGRPRRRGHDLRSIRVTKGDLTDSIFFSNRFARLSAPWQRRFADRRTRDVTEKVQEGRRVEVIDVRNP